MQCLGMGLWMIGLYECWHNWWTTPLMDSKLNGCWKVVETMTGESDWRQWTIFEGCMVSWPLGICVSSVMRWVPPRAAHHDTLLPHTHPEAKMEILRQKTSFPLVCAITVVQVITHHAYFWVRGKISQVWANCFWCAYIAKESRLRLIYWSQMRSYILTEDPSLPL